MNMNEPTGYDAGQLIFFFPRCVWGWMMNVVYGVAPFGKAEEM